MSTPGCPACGGGWPRPDHRVAEFPLSVAYLNEDQFFPGSHERRRLPPSELAAHTARIRAHLPR